MNSLIKGKTVQDLPVHRDPAELANNFGDFFVQKIDNIRGNIENMSINSIPEIESEEPDEKLTNFRPHTEEEVRKIIMSFSNATCDMDPVPTKLVKDLLDVLITPITSLVNISLQTSSFPEKWKCATILPLLKKPGLQPIFKNYRPISNLPFISKVIEKCVISQFQPHIANQNLLPDRQSSYRPFYSTESALIRVMSDLLMAMDTQQVSLVVLLDLSAAFDTVDYDYMIDILVHDFGMIDKVKDWFVSYLTGRRQCVSIKGCRSKNYNLTQGVPQGSCLGPLLFIQYTSQLFKIIERHLPNAMSYADDVQLYLAFKPDSHGSQEAAVQAMQLCIEEVRSWMISHHLKINDSKSEFMIVGSKQMLNKLSLDSVYVGDSEVTSVSDVRNLGMWMDNTLSMNTHVSKVCARAYMGLRNIWQIRRCLTTNATHTIVHAFVTAHLDYCNSLLIGITDENMS